MRPSTKSVQSLNCTTNVCYSTTVCSCSKCSTVFAGTQKPRASAKFHLSDGSRFLKEVGDKIADGMLVVSLKISDMAACLDLVGGTMGRSGRGFQTMEAEVDECAVDSRLLDGEADLSCA